MSVALRLACSGFARSLRFYNDVLGFTTMRYEPEHRRAELERDGVAIELEEGAEGLEYPFGRGVTLVVWTQEAEAIYSGVQAYGARLHQPMREIFREEEGIKLGHAEFEVMDPDGYRLRFAQALPPASRT